MTLPWEANQQGKFPLLQRERRHVLPVALLLLSVPLWLPWRLAAPLALRTQLGLWPGGVVLFILLVLQLDGAHALAGTVALERGHGLFAVVKGWLMAVVLVVAGGVVKGPIVGRVLPVRLVPLP